jgi:DNA-binding NarL/FixJ family response regulator
VAVENELTRGRDALERRAWREAYEALSRADEADVLGADELELLATAAYMLGRDEEYLAALQRAHHAHLEAGDIRRAFRCAFWVGMTLSLRGDVAQGGGWIARGQRLLEQDGEDSVERGYLLMPLVFQHGARGDFDQAVELAGEAATLAERFGDADGHALALHAGGSMLIRAGRVRDGLALLDEAMVAVTTGRLSPIPTGIVYCGVIFACQEAFEPRRASEWTDALARWVAEQPDLVAFTGRCLVHRAEIMQLRGSWADALEEARRASDRFALQVNPLGSGVAFYRQGEILRLLGEHAAADEAYGMASRHGWDPQPGLAQLRLAQGQVDVALAAIRRALSESVDPLKRAVLLPAQVEIALVAGELDEARRASSELDEHASRYEAGMLRALADHARGAVALAEGDAARSLRSLRQAAQAWRELDAPYEVARACLLIGLACRTVGDGDAALRELAAARETFAELGALPDVRRLDAMLAPGGSRDTHGLTSRELEVLGLVAQGRSNRDIAGELVISEHTVARHVQNIFAKLGVSSRAAAVAFAFEHELV